MAFKNKVLVAALVIVGFDAVASFLSRSLQFDYTRLMWFSLLIYIVLGYWGARHAGLIYGVLLATVIGTIDSTIGWFISKMIGPFLQAGNPSSSLPAIALIIIIVIGFSCLCGLVGALLCKGLGQTHRPEAEQ